MSLVCITPGQEVMGEIFNTKTGARSRRLGQTPAVSKAVPERTNVSLEGKADLVLVHSKKLFW